MKIVRNNPDHEHRFAAEQLPWYVAGSLDRIAMARIAEHLGQCAACREEHETEQRLARALRIPGSLGLAPQASLHKLMQRIDEYESGRAPWRWAARFLGALWQPHFHAQRIALGLQSLAIVLLSVALVASLMHSRPAEFRTLSTSTPVTDAGAAQLRVVFDERLTIAEIETLLRPIAGRLVAGPAGGVVTVAVGMDRGDLQATLTHFRAQPGVRFAEAVEN